MTIRSVTGLAGAIIGVVTYVACSIISTSTGVWLGGLDFPYFSDAGREEPAYFVFSIGLTLVAVLFIIATVANVKYVSKVLVAAANASPAMAESTRNHLARTNAAAVFFSVVASICVPLFGFFTTSAYPSIHNYSAYVFFIFYTVYLSLQTAIFTKAAKFVTALATGSNIRLGICVVYALAFIVYIPIGLAITGFPILTMDNCLAFDLGQEFCEKNQDSNNASLTTLYDYSTEYNTENQMRAAAQFVCMVALLAFLGGFVLDPHPNELGGSNENQKLQKEEESELNNA